MQLGAAVKNRPLIYSQLYILLLLHYSSSFYRCIDEEDCEIDRYWLSSLISITKAQFQTSEHMSRWLAKAKVMNDS